MFKLSEVGRKIGREGMSKLAIEHIDECDGSYKAVMELCGKLSVIAKMSTCDEYWLEQVNRGRHKATWDALKYKENKE